MTEKGRDFKHVFNSIIIWANKYLKSCKRTVCHEKCGKEIEIGYYCKNCDEYVDDLIIKELETKNQ